MPAKERNIFEEIIKTQKRTRIYTKPADINKYKIMAEKLNNLAIDSANQIFRSINKSEHKTLFDNFKELQVKLIDTFNKLYEKTGYTEERYPKLNYVNQNLYTFNKAFFEQLVTLLRIKPHVLKLKQQKQIPKEKIEKYRNIEKDVVNFLNATQLIKGTNLETHYEKLNAIEELRHTRYMPPMFDKPTDYQVANSINLFLNICKYYKENVVGKKINYNFHLDGTQRNSKSENKSIIKFRSTNVSKHTIIHEIIHAYFPKEQKTINSETTVEFLSCLLSKKLNCLPYSKEYLNSLQGIINSKEIDYYSIGHALFYKYYLENKTDTTNLWAFIKKHKRYFKDPHLKLKKLWT